MATVFRSPLTTRFPGNPYYSWVTGPSPNPLLLELTAPVAIPFAQLDWPTPTGYRYTHDLRTFLNQIETQLIGQDQFFWAAGQAPTYDYPTPGALRYTLDRTWFNSVSLSLQSIVPTPFNQLEWPTPKAYFYNQDLRTFLNAMEAQLIGQDKFFGASGETKTYDYPTPVALKYTSENRTWLHNIDTNLNNSARPPISQLDWPTPVGRTHPITAKEWVPPSFLALITIQVIVLNKESIEVGISHDFKISAMVALPGGLLV